LKGPIAPLIAAATLITLGIIDKDWRWLKTLRPVTGLLILILVVAPWAIAIGLATHGQFFADAVGSDMATKLAGGQESHGAPPGTYFVLAILTFWPGTLFLLPAFLHGYRNRMEPAFRFLLAWIVPAWLIFEAVPTKLPHYVLPLYPALALLCGGALDAARKENFAPFKSWPTALALLAFSGVALALALGQIALRSFGADHAQFFDALCCIALLTGAGIAAGFMTRRAPRAALGSALLTAALTYGATFGFLAPRLEKLWIAPRIAALLPRDAQGDRPRLIVTGYSEPSLVFLAGTGTLFLLPQEAAGALMVSSNARTVAAVASTAEPAFRAEIAAGGLSVQPIGQVSGLNYSIGKPITLTLYRMSP
jgi:4-amino-4-deoxy-L-arabinose transferase-like glycosyltransferase